MVAVSVKAANAWWLLPGAVALVAVAILDLRMGALEGAAVDVGTGVAFYLAGTLAYLARPANRSAWFLLLMATLLAVGKCLGNAISAAGAAPPSIAASWGAVVLLNAAGWAVLAAGIAVFATFPDGHFQRPYEGWIVRGLPLAFLPLQLLQLLGSAELSTNQFTAMPITAASPLHISGLDSLGSLAGAVVAGSNGGVVLGLVLLIFRYRRFGTEQRQQIKWPLYAVAISAISLAFVFFGPGPPAVPFWLAAFLYVATLAVLPIGLAMGIVVHRSLDIDDVIRRSVVYGVLWAVIAAAFVVVAAVFGIAVGQRVPLVLAVVVTIAATLVFQPARRRLEQLADKLVFGPRLGGYELISQLGARLETSTGAEDVASTVAAAVKSGLGARWVRVSLNRPVLKLVAAEGIGATESALPGLSAPLVHGGEVVGVIECGPKQEGSYNRADEQLLATLGRQAALAIRNSQLAYELSQRLEELEASRARLVHAEDEGRRRLERDLHDGVQQELVGLLARVSLARNQLTKNRDGAAATLRQVQDDARRALETVQEVARGIHPAVLSDRGLIEAVEERVTRMTIPVAVVIEGMSREARLPAQLEGGAYFFISEALTNVMKHAHASHVVIRFRSDGQRRLVIEVQDDGRGFDPVEVKKSGLSGLADRIEALGGQMEMASGNPHGSVLRASLPLGESVHG
jgi:signal transduction histidine kinase